MQLLRTPKTSDCFGRYYTAQEVAGLLIKTMNLDQPKTVIDLGVGDGALIREASLTWTEAKFITVDIDKNSEKKLLSNISPSLLTHHIGSALEYNLDRKLGIALGSIDSAVCNPPYILPKWNAHFHKILEDAKLHCVTPKSGCIPAEVLFIAQNLRFLREGGTLGLILPDGLIAGEKFSKLRETLATTHRIERIIELPRRIFRKTDAKAHIMVLSKSLSPTKSIKLQRLELNGELSAIIEIPIENACHRLDYSYLELNTSEHQEKTKKSPSLRDVTIELKRGSFSSKDKKNSNLKILHTTDFTSDRLNVPNKLKTKKTLIKNSTFVIAQPGDILIARVGRNLNQKIWKVTSGSVIITDCIFLLRVRAEYTNKVFAYLTSNEGREGLMCLAHGVGAKFITTEGLLDMKISGTI